MNSYGLSNQIFSVSGKKAIVTGGARGLAKDMTIWLLENGCDVFIADLKTGGSEDIIEFAKKIGRNLYFHACDLTKTDQVVEMVSVAKKSMGRIDILVNAAGINILKPFTEMDDASFAAVMNVNVNALFAVTREVAKVMKEQKYGKIMNMSSIRSMLGASDIGYVAYSTSKSAVNMLTRQAACELAAYNITVNALMPTMIKTAMNAAQLDDEDFRKSLEARVPTGRIGEFRDLMGLLLLFTSDASEFINGQTIFLDGGISARQ